MTINSSTHGCDCNDYPTLESGVMRECRWARYAYELENRYAALVEAARQWDKEYAEMEEQAGETLLDFECEQNLRAALQAIKEEK